MRIFEINTCPAIRRSHQEQCAPGCIHCVIPELRLTAVMQNSKLSDTNQLLLDIYTNIDEPDGLYAIARSAHPDMQCALFAHEGRNPEELPGLFYVCFT